MKGVLIIALAIFAGLLTGGFLRDALELPAPASTGREARSAVTDGLSEVLVGLGASPRNLF